MPESSIPKRVGPKVKEISTEVGVSRRHEPSARDTERAEKAARALQASQSRTPVEARKATLVECQRQLKDLPVGAALQLITDQQGLMLEVFLLAEEAGRARTDILKFFPPVGHLTRLRYLPESVPVAG